MSQYKIGLIGCGNMGSAILGGILQAGLAEKEEIVVSAKSSETQRRVEKDYGVKTVADNREVAMQSSIIFLAVKPNVFETVIPQIRDAVDTSKLVISIAAGQSLQQIENMFQKKIRLIRSMPNTPALVGEAMSALTANDNATEDDRNAALKLFKSFGEAEYVPESLMDAVIGVSGSSPAYVYMFIEALADGAVKEGMPRKQAYLFAAQSVLGSAKMVLETKEHPGVLKDAVCSPGGTTIAGVAELENRGFRAAVIAGECACADMSREMTKA